MISQKRHVVFVIHGLEFFRRETMRLQKELKAMQGRLGTWVGQVPLLPPRHRVQKIPPPPLVLLST